MESIVRSIPGISQDQIDYVMAAIKAEDIVLIKHNPRPSEDSYQTDDIYAFKNAEGYRVFSVLIHPDDSIHIWRPC